MNALKIKPGKYRTFEGDVVTIEYIADHVAHGKTFTGQPVTFALLAHGVSAGNLVERIEDEPKAEEQSRIVGAVECSVETGKQVRGFVTKAAYDALWNVIGCERDSYIRELTTARCMVLTADEYDALVQAARVVEDCKFYVKTVEGFAQHAQAVTDEQRKQITRLEAENEFLSRQLRSRELNKEPASAGKVWRWSPMV